MVTLDEYRKKEQEFMDRCDSLCENVSPDLCDCSKCPTRELCEWLYDNHPYPINNTFMEVTT